MGKYSPNDIKKMLYEITTDPKVVNASGKAPEEMQETYKRLTTPENLDVLAEICNILGELEENVEGD